MAKYKNSGAGTVVNVLAIILAVAGCAAALYSNTIDGYAFGMYNEILMAAGAGIACALLATIIEAVAGPQNFFAFLVKWVAVVAVMIVIALIVNERAGDVASLFSWDTTNENGFLAFYTAVAAVACDLVAVIFMIAVGSSKGKKIA